MFEKAYSIANTTGLITPAPRQKNDSKEIFLIWSQSAPGKLHHITVHKTSLQCSDCSQFSTFGICSHSIAVALKIDALDTFLKYRNGKHKTPSLETLATAHFPKSRGTKKHARVEIRIGGRKSKQNQAY
jgi:hypothetical protein